jgi:hypothetical protein
MELLGIAISKGIEACIKLDFALLFSPLPSPYFIIVAENIADGRHACANKTQSTFRITVFIRFDS